MVGASPRNMATGEDHSTHILILIAVVVLAVALGLLHWVRRANAPRSATAPVMSAEAKAYLPNISVTEARMSAAENFLRSTVTYLDARVTNGGSRAIRCLDLQLEFHDTMSQLVLRETAHPINFRTPPLKPGETRAFRVAFDHMPAEWNQAPPTMTVVYLSF